MKYTHSRLCQINHTGCFGCCGHTFGSKDEADIAIKKNTLEFAEYTDKREFMNRSQELRECGICRNLIRLPNGKLGCPLHPAVNEEDLRVGHCDVEHLCKAAQLFDSWDEKKQKKFLRFIKKQKLDWYDYSIKIDNDELINAFEAENPQTDCPFPGS
ncbi:MAG: hypothetical protein V1837_04565 [Candidatus Woesearchaeota archaeon]